MSCCSQLVVAPLIEKMPPAIRSGMTSWYDVKMFIEHASVISSDAIHVLIGVAVWVTAALVSRRPLSGSIPWLAALGLTLLNEAIDLSIERWPSLSQQLGESAKDVLLTMALPTLLLIAIRLRPNLFRPGSRRR